MFAGFRAVVLYPHRQEVNPAPHFFPKGSTAPLKSFTIHNAFWTNSSAPRLPQSASVSPWQDGARQQFGSAMWECEGTLSTPGASMAPVACGGLQGSCCWRFWNALRVTEQPMQVPSRGEVLQSPLLTPWFTM